MHYFAVNKETKCLQFLFDFKELRHKTNNVVQKACLFAFMKLDTKKVTVFTESDT